MTDEAQGRLSLCADEPQRWVREGWGRGCGGFCLAAAQPRHTLTIRPHPMARCWHRCCSELVLCLLPILSLSVSLPPSSWLLWGPGPLAMTSGFSMGTGKGGPRWMEVSVGLQMPWPWGPVVLGRKGPLGP